jgi:hypothetical protein
MYRCRASLNDSIVSFNFSTNVLLSAPVRIETASGIKAKTSSQCKCRSQTGGPPAFNGGRLATSTAGFVGRATTGRGLAAGRGSSVAAIE